MKVSVVVPVWNPGPNLGRCLDSLLGQTLAPDDYELVLVDDGSTDGTAARLDALAAELGDRVQVLHIPNSGWPGRPRNVGVAAALGEYVQFVDNDDVLDRGALKSLYELASASEADIVLGKLSSDFRGVNRGVFRKTVTRRTVADYPVIDSLTPHKLFRRAFLEQHSIRFPEGRTILEDQVYVVRAYVKATSIAVLADHACYFYLRRIGSGRNAGDVAMVPGPYAEALGQVLDVIEQEVPPGELRDRLHRRFYTSELLGRLSGKPMLGYAAAYRRELTAAVRSVVTRHFAAGVHHGSGAAIRLQGRLLRDGDLPALVALAEQYERISLRATTAPPRWRDGALRLDVRAALHWGDDLLRCERSPTGWVLPAGLAPDVPADERAIGDERDQPDTELTMISRADSVSFALVNGLEVRIDDDGVIRVEGTVSIDPRTAMGNRPLTDGVWDVRVWLRFAGWSRTAPLAPVAGLPEPPAPALMGDGRAVIPYWTRPKPTIALDVGQWTRALAAETAPTSTLRTARRRDIVCTLQLAGLSGSPGLDAHLLWEPLDGTTGGVLALPIRLVPGASTVSATARRPRLPRNGVWRVWLRIGELGGSPASALPWFVRRRGARLIIERLGSG
ncbi:MAG: glycosyltransferase family 2 protein [Jatrophihabitans sp.]